MGEKQVNYLEKIREAFGCADIDVDERVKNVNIHLSVAPSSLPNEAGLRGLISLFPEQDSVRAFLNDDSGSVYTITSNAPFDEETYVAFKAACLRMYLFLSRLRLQKVLRTGIYRSIALRNLLMIF